MCKEYSHEMFIGVSKKKQYISSMLPLLLIPSWALAFAFAFAYLVISEFNMVEKAFNHRARANQHILAMNDFPAVLRDLKIVVLRSTFEERR